MIGFVLNKIALFSDCFSPIRHWKESLNQKALQSIVNNDFVFLRRRDNWMCIRNKSAEDIIVRNWEIVFDDGIESGWYSEHNKLLCSTEELYCRPETIDRKQRKAIGYRITFRRTISGREANFTVTKLLSDVQERWKARS